MTTDSNWKKTGCEKEPCVRHGRDHWVRQGRISGSDTRKNRVSNRDGFRERRDHTVRHGTDYIVRHWKDRRVRHREDHRIRQEGSWIQKQGGPQGET